MSTPDGEPIEIDLSGAAGAAESLRRVQASLNTTALGGLQSRLAELSSRAADVVGAERFASRIHDPVHDSRSGAGRNADLAIPHVMGWSSPATFACDLGGPNG